MHSVSVMANTHSVAEQVTNVHGVRWQSPGRRGRLDGFCEFPSHRRPRTLTTALDRPLEPGTLIAHNYRVSQRLGAGGMGTVYLAENVTLAQRVVVKMMRGAQTGAGQEEAQMLANLQHPNVVTVFAHDPRLDCIVMEFLDGSSLSSLVEKGIDRINSIRIAMAIADALAAVHRRGLVHRDIKPENVMLSLNLGGGRLVDWLKLIDFGLALKAGKTPPVLLGTAEYCGPEQFSAQSPAHPGNDVYALGVTLFLMLTGTFPFTGTFEELPSQKATAPLPSLLTTLANRPDAPKLDPRTTALFEDLDELLQQMLAHQVDQRPSASEVARRLQKFESSFAEAGTYVGGLATPSSGPALAAVRTVRARTGVLSRSTDPVVHAGQATPQHLVQVGNGSDTSSTTPDMGAVDASPTVRHMPILARPKRDPPERVTDPAIAPRPKTNWVAFALAVVVLGLGLAVAFVEPAGPKPAPPTTVAAPPQPPPQPTLQPEPTAADLPQLPPPVANEPSVDAGSVPPAAEEEELAALTPVKTPRKPKTAGKTPVACVIDQARLDTIRAEYNALLKTNPDVEDLESELIGAMKSGDCRKPDAVLAKMRDLKN